jgi:hypothetical protein
MVPNYFDILTCGMVLAMLPPLMLLALAWPLVLASIACICCFCSN